MKKNFFARIAFLGLTALILTSCSKVPQVEIDAANAAIEEAKTAGADVYAHDEFIALQDSLSGVMVKIEVQKSKLIKNYALVKDQLVAVAKFAAEVKQQTESKKEAVKVEIQTTMAEVMSLIETNKQLILESPKGKEGTTALLAIKGEINVIENSIREANMMFEKGEYLASLDKVKAAKEKATSINMELSEVIAKYKVNTKHKKS